MTAHEHEEAARRLGDAIRHNRRLAMDLQYARRNAATAWAVAAFATLVAVWSVAASLWGAL